MSLALCVEPCFHARMNDDQLLREADPGESLQPSATGARGWLGELWRSRWQLAAELDYAPSTLDMEFLSFLRMHSRLGFFIFGPIAIDLRVVEEQFYASAARGQGGPDHPPTADDLVRFSRTVVQEMRRTGRKDVDELTFLRAFMRTPEGLPGRVFGELGVSVEDVGRYITELSAGRPPERATAERLLSTEEAAEYFRVHVQTVRAWIRAGKLPASKLAGQKSIRIKESDLTRVLEPIGPDEEGE